MKILFFYNGVEYLGIEYLSSFLKSRGHETYLFFDSNIFYGDVFVNIKHFANHSKIYKAAVRRVEELRPEIVAFSAYTGNYRWCLEIAEVIKQVFECTIVFGGIHPTAVPERVLANTFIDYVIVGEGEYAMLDLVECLADDKLKGTFSSIPNIYFFHEGSLHLNSPRPYISNLDALPFPDKQLFFQAEPLFQSNKYLIMTSRGCPFNCSYCSNSLLKKIYCQENQHVRRRSPDNVIEELLLAKKYWKGKSVVFMDDVFTISKQWLEHFAEKYRSKIGLPFHCLAHPLTINNENVALLKEAGCASITLGVQSGSERIRRDIFDRKGSNEDILNAIASLKEAGISVQIDHIFGAPTENQDDLRQSLELYRKAKPDTIFTYWLTYYPGTRIISLAKENEGLADGLIDDIEEGHVGYTHGYGSVPEKKIPLYTKYELLFQLSTLFKNYDMIYQLLTKLVTYFPFKKSLA